MTIRQHRRVMGTPTHLTMNDASVTIRFSDADPSRRIPRPHPDPTLPEGALNHYEEADEHAFKRWKSDIGTLLVHEMGIRPKARPGDRFVLSKMPKNYKLYVHLKGDRDDPRKDYYLVGSKLVNKFRSPEEFVFHAKWLAFGAPLNSKGESICACKYCRKNDQSEIGQYLYEKAGFLDEEPRHRASKPVKKKRGQVEDGISYKDYTHLLDRTNDLKPLRIKDEED